MTDSNLNSSVDSFLRAEYFQFFKVILHNEKIFELNQKLHKTEYLNIKEKVIELYMLFSVMDKNIMQPILDKLMRDIINLVFFYEELDLDASCIWEKFKEQNSDCDIDFEAFKHVHSKLVRDYKIKTSLITSNRVYLFDSILWKNANESRNIVKYTKGLGITWADTTKEFLEQTTFNELPCLDLKRFFKNDKILFPVYSKDEIDLILSISNGSFFKMEENELLDRVIKAKKGFKFLRNIDDIDIRHVIKNLKFMIYKRHEIVVKEGDKGDEIYLLIDGECRVTAGKNVVGLIKKGDIFGEFSPVTGEPRSATIRTNSSTAKLLSFQIAFEKFDDEPKIFAQLYRNIAESLICKIDTSNKRG